MRHIAKTINLSEFKSYVKSLIPACKDREAIDIREEKNQDRLNVDSNHSMCPYITKAIIKVNGESIIRFWSWQTLHKIYRFFMDNTNMCIENLEAVDYEGWFGTDDINFLINNYERLKELIITYVETGIESKNDLIDFYIIDDLEPWNYCEDYVDYFPCYKENREDPNGIYKEEIKENGVYRRDLEHVDDLQCYSNIAIPLFISNKVDNVGMMDNLPDEWEGQTPYSIGNLVFYDSNDWVLTDKTPNNPNKYQVSQNGYTWDKTFKESLFGNIYYDIADESYEEYDKNNAPWVRNIEHEMTNPDRKAGDFELDGKDFSSFMGEEYYTGGTKFYAYKGWYFIPEPNNLKMGEKYDFVTLEEDCIIYDGELVEVKDYEMVKDFNCDPGYYEVIGECNDKYHYLNYTGEKVYGYKGNGNHYIFEYYGQEFYSETIHGLYFNNKFIEFSGTYFEPENSNSSYEVIKKGAKCVKIDGKWYKLNGNNIEVYAGVGQEESNVVVYQFTPTTELGVKLENDNIDENVLGYCSDNSSLYAVEPYTVNRLNYVTGITESQLSLFRIGDVIFDELGNSIEGALLEHVEEPSISAKTVNYGVLRPLPYDSLSLIYAKSSAKNTKVMGDNKIMGDILANIEFYIPLNDDDEAITSTKIGVSNFDKLTTGEQLHKIYEKLNIDYTESSDKFELKTTSNKVNFTEVLQNYNTSLRCKFTYHIGAFLEYDEENNIYSLADGLHKGVKYTEDYIIERLSVPYYRSVNDGYPIYTYQLTPVNSIVTEDDSHTIVNLANFEMEIPVFKLNNDEKTVQIDEKREYIENSKIKTEPDENHYADNEIDKLDINKNFISVPVIHRDFNNGIVSQESVEGNIYIDRGISSSFEKHLKLQEVATMDDLVTYSNGGFFNITSDNG